MNFTRSVENVELRRIRVDHEKAFEALRTLNNAALVTCDLA